MRTKKDKPTAPPLADTLRAALASDWHSLAALDTLTAARGSDARRLVHEALRVLRGEGCVLEERVGRAGVEVRLLTLPAPVPDDGQPGDLSPEDIEAIRNALLEAEADGDGAAYTDEIPPLSPAAAARMADLIEHPPAPSEALRALCRGGDEPDDYTRFHAALAVGVGAPAPPVDQAAPVESPRERTAAEWIASHNHEAAPAPKGPGPSSRCAVCDRPYARHADAAGVPYAGPEGHPFQPKPRGRPPATPSKQPPIPNAAPAILPRARQRRTPGPVVDVDGGRVERATPSEQRAILAGMAEKWDAAVAEHRAERAGAEPETSRGEAPGEQDHGEQDQEQGTDVEPTDAQPSGAGARAPSRGGARRDARSGVDHQERQRAAPLEAGGQDQGRGARVSRGRGKAVEPVGLKLSACRPPLCYRDDIHEPARVRGFARPLCERHRAWVEGAGGSVRYEPKTETV